MQSQKQLSLTCAFKFTTHVRIADKKNQKLNIPNSMKVKVYFALQAISITLVNENQGKDIFGQRPLISKIKP